VLGGPECSWSSSWVGSKRCRSPEPIDLESRRSRVKIRPVALLFGERRRWLASARSIGRSAYWSITERCDPQRRREIGDDESVRLHQAQRAC